MITKRPVFLLLATLLVSGCVSAGGAGRMMQSTEAGVVLKESNYKILKTGAKGSSYGFKLLGFIPITSPSYADAKKELYESVNEPLEGRAVALANQTEDHKTIYLILFSLPKIVLSADVIEFNPPPRN
jgi:hypothetical protein